MDHRLGNDGLPRGRPLDGGYGAREHYRAVKRKVISAKRSPI